MAQPVTDDELWQRKLARRRLVGAVVLVLLVVVFLPWVLDEKPKPLTKNVDVQIPAIDPPEKKFGAPAASNGSAATPPAANTAPPAADTGGAAVSAPSQTSAQNATTGNASPATALPPSTESGGGGTASAPGAFEPAPTGNASAPSTQAGVADVKPEPMAEPEPPAVRPVVKEPEIRKPETAKAETTKTTRKPVAAAGQKYIVPLGTFSKEENARRLAERVRGEGLPVYVEKLRASGDVQSRVRLGPFSSEGAAERARKLIVQKGIAPGPTKVVRLD